MSGGGQGPAGRETVSFAVIKGEDGDDIVASVLESQPDVRLIDKGTYWQLETEGTLVIDVEDVSERAGRTFTSGDLQVCMATYVGRIDVTFSQIVITSDMLQMGGAVG